WEDNGSLDESIYPEDASLDNGKAAKELNASLSMFSTACDCTQSIAFRCSVRAAESVLGSSMPSGTEAIQLLLEKWGLCTRLQPSREKRPSEQIPLSWQNKFTESKPLSEEEARHYLVERYFHSFKILTSAYV
ncbi:hypothetical protein M514_03385, partial [Trichuris suis]